MKYSKIVDIDSGSYLKIYEITKLSVSILIKLTETFWWFLSAQFHGFHHYLSSKSGPFLACDIIRHTLLNEVNQLWWVLILSNAYMWWINGCGEVLHTKTCVLYNKTMIRSHNLPSKVKTSYHSISVGCFGLGFERFQRLLNSIEKTSKRSKVLQKQRHIHIRCFDLSEEYQNYM